MRGFIDIPVRGVRAIRAVLIERWHVVVPPSRRLLPVEHPILTVRAGVVSVGSRGSAF